MANQFYEITLKALNKLESIDNINSKVIAKYWQEALIDLNKNYSKGCPQNSFASLILNNHVVFEGKKSLLNDTNTKEYKYCLCAIDILKSSNDIRFSSTNLWRMVINSLKLSRSHQGEMDVVLALWESGRIR
jgi:hypothetical protein